MNVWLITIGENLPIPGFKDRLMRTGVLADRLHGEGHSVLWWTSTVDHMRKRYWFPEETDLNLAPGYRLRLLHGAAYTTNISLARVRNHRQLAAGFRRAAPKEERPDVIVCSFPTIELSAEAVRFGKAFGVPVLLDVRDLWPDALVDLAPSMAQSLVRSLVSGAARQAREAMSGATGLIGISQNYLDWGLALAGRPAGPFDAVVPLGYRPPDISSAERQAAWTELRRLGVSESQPLALFIGSMGQTYDLETVIDAARLLKRQKVSLQVVLCGTGERFDALKKRAHGLDNLVFTGWQRSAGLAELSQRAHIGLMAYRAGAPQSLPNKLFEYLCSGVAVLSSLEAETGVLLRRHQCGQTYRPGDSARLAGLLASMSEDLTSSAKMGENARALYTHEFSETILNEKIVSKILHTKNNFSNIGKTT